MVDFKHSIDGDVKPIKDHILVEEMSFTERKTKGGIILLDDDAKSEGIRPRWAKVYSLGPKYDGEIEVGNWILIDHGRWTRGVKIGSGQTIRRVDNKDVLLVTDEKPNDEIMGINN